MTAAGSPAEHVVVSLSCKVHRVAPGQPLGGHVVTACGKWLTQGHNGVGAPTDFTAWWLTPCKQCATRKQP